MQLLQHLFQLFGNRQTQVRGVFQQAHTFIGKVEENHRRPQNTCPTEHIDIQNVSDAHKGEDQHLAADSFEAHFAGKVLVRDGTQNAGDVVDDHKGNQGIQKSIHSAEKPAEKAAQGSERDLNAIPNLFHIRFLLIPL